MNRATPTNSRSVDNVPNRESHIVAYSGLLDQRPGDGDNFDFVNYALGLTETTDRPRVCYLPTAVGDDRDAIARKRELFATNRPDVIFDVLTFFDQPNVSDVTGHLHNQDLILVEGGSVVNLMAIWRAHGLPQILRDCWRSGVVLAGSSAGSLCWHLGGPTDSFRDQLDPFISGLGLLPFSNGVHDDLEDQPRRHTYRAMVKSGILPPGYATEGGAGLHYVGTELHEVIGARAGAQAWHVTTDDTGQLVEQPLPARLINVAATAN